MRSGEEVARRRIIDALASDYPVSRLSDVIWDSVDRDTHGFLVDHDFDADDLAAVLFTVLTTLELARPWVEFSYQQITNPPGGWSYLPSSVQRVTEAQDAIDTLRESGLLP